MGYKQAATTNFSNYTNKYWLDSKFVYVILCKQVLGKPQNRNSTSLLRIMLINSF